jgi:hypothetical protein
MANIHRITVGLFLVLGRDLEREGITLLECIATIYANARHVGDADLRCQHIAGFSGSF